MAKTKIEWCDEVWNPTVGCQKVSAGCANCYAERMAARLLAMGRQEYENTVGILSGKWTGHVKCLPNRLDIPLGWKKPRRVFVNSMSDLFHEDVPDGFISAVWSRIITTPQHTYIILTKRPERMANLVPLLFREWPNDNPVIQPNVWLGVSVEDQRTADERIPLLLQTPAAVRFVSVEPMLGPVDIGMSIAKCECCDRWSSRWVKLYRKVTSDMPNYYPVHVADPGIYRAHSNRHGALSVETGNGLLGIKPGEFECLPKIDWVICGAESGPSARMFDVDWARSLRDQCVEAGVPYFLKQMQIDGKLVKMPELDGQQWKQYPGGGK